jgi:hypothetical protein
MSKDFDYLIGFQSAEPVQIELVKSIGAVLRDLDN